VGSIRKRLSNYPSRIDRNPSAPIFLLRTSYSISDLERGKVQVTAFKLSKITDYLEILIISFFSKEKKMRIFRRSYTPYKNNPRM